MSDNTRCQLLGFNCVFLRFSADFGAEFCPWLRLVEDASRCASVFLLVELALG